MLVLYYAAVYAYVGLIRLAALWLPKAKLWVQGRQQWRQQLAARYTAGGPTVWMHCASLGEFEQGRPLLEAMKQQHPTLRVVLTFYSPSGYEVRKHYALADIVLYLPPDLLGNAKDFVQIIRPTLAVFVKYELWYGYLRALQQAQVPAVLISAHVRAGHGMAGGLAKYLYRQVFAMLRWVFVQQPKGLAAVQQVLHQTQTSVAGDTRFDRVLAIAQEAAPISAVAQWLQQRPCLVAGSTWPADEALLHQAWGQLHTQHPDACLIIAPHVPGPAQVQQLLQQFGAVAITHSQLEHAHAQHRVLIIDNVGLLARLYRYGRISYVGGGFNSGIHNILEAAVYGIPVLFGPRHQRFHEALALVALGGAYVVPDANTLLQHWQSALNNTPAHQQAALVAGQYVRNNQGATARILQQLATLGLWPPKP